MSKEADFLIYCMERYRYLKKLSGADVAKIFEKYDIYSSSCLFCRIGLIGTDNRVSIF